MSVLEDQIKKTLLPGMAIPKELSLLFSWIEERGYYVDTDNGRIGCLYSADDATEDEDLDEDIDDDELDERAGGTTIEFFPEGNANLHYWFGHNKPEVINRLCVFAKTGGEGSMAALWLDPDGQQKIVHLGSGSGSTLVCVLADQPIDFLRLLAIGYDELCWNDYFDQTPSESAEDVGLMVHPNLEYQQWLTSTFGVGIPKKASEIVLHPSEMGDVNSQDPFCRWLESAV